MKKIEKRKYLTPETEVVRFNVEDIITTSGEYELEEMPDKYSNGASYSEPGV